MTVANLLKNHTFEHINEKKTINLDYKSTFDIDIGHWALLDPKSKRIPNIKSSQHHQIYIIRDARLEKFSRKIFAQQTITLTTSP